MAALLILPPASEADAKKASDSRLTMESRVWILRTLQSEAATVRKPLPRGDKGLPLDSNGTIDEKELLRLTTNNGVAIRAGEVVQITKLQFKKDAIVLEINGGGRQKRKWYERIEVGMGGSTRPVNTGQSMEPPQGSSIVLNFGREIPDITVDDVKQMLDPVLDFSRRSAGVMFIETLPKEIQEAIKNNQVLKGMNRDMVLAARGRPDRKIRERRGNADVEDWIYGVAPAKITFVTFDGDEVIEVKEYTPGIASDAARAMEKADASASPTTVPTATPAAAAPAPPAAGTPPPPATPPGPRH